ncbi:MAG: NAD(P)/FAD-dependent oxidoreductase [Candidatus Bathyarchaeia archaeon]|nr:NAD(P)/FAD-dependent oxidoreductase [Candidatus Bathyarchaeia archaeon]
MTHSDVIIVGGGPCGSFTALNLAKLGINVTVFEEHGEIGVPSHCTGHLSIKNLKRLGLYPLPAKIVENIFYGAIFHSPDGKEFSVRFSSPVTCVVNRTIFDKYVAEMAEDAGAYYCLNSRVESVIFENCFVKGVSVKQHEKAEKKFLAKIVVDAEGISSRILRQTGLSTFNRHMLVNAVQAELENVKNLKTDMIEVFLGRDYAPGFYAWLIPKLDGKANVGLAAKAGNPKKLLRKLMLKHPVASKKLHKAKILQISFHPITLGGPIPKTYSNGFLAVGDAASQVKSTTGGGVIFGMTCARVAAKVAYEALRKNDFSQGFLSVYQERCEEIWGFDANVMLKVRKMLDVLSDDKIDDAINFCAKFGLDKVLQNIEDIDFQGRSLLCILRNPRVSTALLYFLLLYLL